MTGDAKKSEGSIILDINGGSNQIRVRAYNERLVLDLVRRHHGLSKADIARRSGLSAQTVSVIMRALEREGLLIRGELLRGKVGQPSTPMKLNPDAVFSIGIKIGRRSTDIVLMDFVGTVRHKLRHTYQYPSLKWILPFVIDGIKQLEAHIPKSDIKKICGIGIAAPFELWSWSEEVGAPQEELDEWRQINLRDEIMSRTEYPVFFENDATSACGAELVFGRGQSHPDFLYIFIGSFIGGGVVLNSSLFSGRSGTAGALGPLPVQGPDGTTKPILKIASVIVLEQALRTRNIDPNQLWQTPDQWHDFGEPLDTWINNCGAAIAQAAIAASSIIDFAAVIIDGSFPDNVRRRIVQASHNALQTHDLQGLRIPETVEGMLGSQARAIGAAALPLFARYLLDQKILFKESAI